jgi:hypothetical protein
MADTKPKHPGGRPTKFTQDLADLICKKISTSNHGLRQICEMPDINLDVSTVMDWARNNKEFSQQYAKAKQEQADFLADEIIQIADDATNDFMTITKGDVTYNVENKEWTNRSRLRIDARKWVASKLKPKVYGDKTDITSGGEQLKQTTIVINTTPDIAADIAKL